MIPADIWIHLENVKRHLRTVCRILGLSPLLRGDHVYHVGAPAREMVVINADDPQRIEIRAVGLNPGDPTAHVNYDQLRLWSEQDPIDPSFPSAVIGNPGSSKRKQ